MSKTNLKITSFLLIFFFFFFKNVPSCFSSATCNSQWDVNTYCYNGPSNGDSGGCGTACGSGDAWSKYQCKSTSIEFGQYSFYWYRIDNVCSTGDKCVSGDKGLSAGYCYCGSVGGLYKTCCQGSTPVNCINYGVQDNYSPPEGTCPSGSTIVYGTSCPSATHKICSDNKKDGSVCPNNCTGGNTGGVYGSIAMHFAPM